jgi:polyisoprenoid-binding protein YceI
MNKLLFLFLAAALLPAKQSKMLTKTGKITFEASVPAFEEVKATSQSVTCVLNPATGEIASQALMKSFRFKTALMEEHFNENYAESDKYPKATFRGNIENFDAGSLSATSRDFTIKGKLEMHGKTKDITAPAKIRKSADGIEINTDFNVTTDDFDIEIPAVVSKKVSKKVSVSCSFTVK